MALKRFQHRLKSGDNQSPFALFRAVSERIVDRFDYVSKTSGRKDHVVFRREEALYIMRLFQLIEESLDKIERAYHDSYTFGALVERKLDPKRLLNAREERRLQRRYHNKYKGLLRKFLTVKTELTRGEVDIFLRQIDPDMAISRMPSNPIDGAEYAFSKDSRKARRRLRKDLEQTSRPSQTKS